MLTCSSTALSCCTSELHDFFFFGWRAFGSGRAVLLPPVRRRDPIDAAMLRRISGSTHRCSIKSDVIGSRTCIRLELGSDRNLILEHPSKTTLTKREVEVISGRDWLTNEQINILSVRWGVPGSPLLHRLDAGLARVGTVLNGVVEVGGHGAAGSSRAGGSPALCCMC